MHPQEYENTLLGVGQDLSTPMTPSGFLWGQKCMLKILWFATGGLRATAGFWEIPLPHKDNTRRFEWLYLVVNFSWRPTTKLEADIPLPHIHT